MVCYNITAYNEIINFTVSKREVYNSKLRAGIKAERGMVMKGKNLERAVILGLILSAGVYGTAWASYNTSIDNNGELILNTDEQITYLERNEPTYTDKNGTEVGLSKFKNVVININSSSSRNFGLYIDACSNEITDLSNTSFTITMNGNNSNADALHTNRWNNHLKINNFTAYVYTPNSDVVNVGHESTAVVEILGDLNAYVTQGNGIRANASTGDRVEPNTVIIHGNSNITITGENIKGPSVGGIFSTSYDPAGVYAGNSHRNSTNSKASGLVILEGKTTITTAGAKTYAILAGKNGKVQVSDFNITANGDNAYGIAAKNINLIYNSGLFADKTENHHGSTVILNGINNKITMNGENSKAIYADSQYGVVKSGDNGIGNIDIIGDIAADNSGKIDLTIREWGDITGNIEATNGATIKLGMAENTSDTSLMSETEGAINIKGNVQAANGAEINLSLGDGAYFEGRVDDYKDADNKDTWDKIDHGSLFDEDFVNDNSVDSSGKVNLTLGNNATWSVTEQSWATTVNTDNSIIDLTNGNNKNYAVHIGDLNGDATFVVNLDPDTKSDTNNGNMIYVYNGKDADNLNLRINNETDVLTGLANGERLRFATVANAGGGFGDTYVARGRGVINSGFSIEYEDYDTADTEENNKYNGGTEFDETKPGSDYVDGIYGNGENVYLVRDSSKDAGKSDSGATIINMSRANYKNAIYMDRLNKRMGEMRYVNGEEEQGLWVRLRHDRIGQSGDFRSMNTMYEVGYDVKQPTDNGEHRIGMAIDYMRGSTTYDDIMGKGETKRYGLWLYDTWLGEKGHYTDYIVKWGHLSNDFDIRDKDSLENITGDYSNNVFSVSAEYGKKNDMGKGWYFEPQIQAQLARVTGADYRTTQGSEVSVDGINSLIGRAGFRIGRDMDENSTIYLKADLLHEFLGDQTITATDVTGTLREEYENEGTWYDVGFGFATKMSKNSYAFMDFEKSFGNDNDETYQINAGMQWMF